MFLWGNRTAKQSQKRSKNGGGRSWKRPSGGLNSIPFDANYSYRIDLTSRAFDAFLYVKKGNQTLAFDDDSGDFRNARLYFDPPDTGDFSVWATTYLPGAIGEYQLEVSGRGRTLG
jgi:hypothetical protein